MHVHGVLGKQRRGEAVRVLFKLTMKSPRRALPAVQSDNSVQDQQEQDHTCQKNRLTIRHDLIKDSPKEFLEVLQHGRCIPPDSAFRFNPLVL
jgi:hypothetical protein